MKHMLKLQGNILSAICMIGYNKGEKMKKKNKRSYDSRKKHPVNRAHKDRLFRLVFQEKKDLLALYNAVNGTDYRNPEDLTITTLEDAVFLGVKNDLSFIIGATLNLYEHQSTWNGNMPLRGLIYFASLYQEFAEQNEYSLYGRRMISLPFPQYLVFYNGEEDEPGQIELSLSDAFQKPEKDLLPSVDCRVRILNINRGHNRELMEKCRRLWEYTEFIAQVRANLKEGLNIRAAVNAAMDDCQRRGILADLLSRCRTEVLNMLLTEYDEKKTMDYLHREAREIGREMAQEIAQEIAQEMAQDMAQKMAQNMAQELSEELGHKYAEQYAELINRLNCLLIEDNRYEDLAHASKDKEYQKKLLQEYDLSVNDRK